MQVLSRFNFANAIMQDDVLDGLVPASEITMLGSVLIKCLLWYTWAKFVFFVVASDCIDCLDDCSTSELSELCGTNPRVQELCRKTCNTCAINNAGEYKRKALRYSFKGDNQGFADKALKAQPTSHK